MDSRLMDARFFNNHHAQTMRKELEFARRTCSSFRIKCWIDFSNELLLQHYNNIKSLSDYINRLLKLEREPRLILSLYGSMMQYKQTLINLLKHSELMLASLYERWDILVEASIILKHTENMEHAMALQVQKEQQIRICIE